MKIPCILVIVVFSVVTNCRVINTSVLDTVYLRKYACVRSEHIHSDVSYMDVASKSECGMLNLQANSSAAMIVFTRSDGVICCGLTTQLPFPSACTDEVSDVKVYTHLPPQVAPQECTIEYELYGIRYCAFLSTYAMLYNETHDYCESLGGTVAEAETMDQVQLFLTLTSPYRYVYVGGTNFYPDGQFRWNRGDLVNDTLYYPNEPNNNNGIEHCLAIHTTVPEKFGLSDTPCSFQSEVLCAFTSQ